MTQITTINPATDTKIASYDVMSSDQAFDKVERCQAAFLDWRGKSPVERAPYLRKIAQGLRDNADAFASLMTEETGKLLRDGYTEVELCAQLFEYSADHGPDLLADEERTLAAVRKAGSSPIVRSA
ncbi:hypothetical protein GCM10009069_18500 [Algimonas arctica]|uniref:Aldehyde dehydrogenase domain-containing protein n=1 Tax=Algimonas arctica TaxID=1479486 RepID=A0A8J3CQS0_9PROT|nr:aldehyde dehydrogenase family protein [Algimonas arctica]GHA95934.1 hypothetical protein GCM10009069_18500 [Algimonas arctica]